MTFNEADRTLGDEIGHVTFTLHRLSVFIEIGNAWLWNHLPMRIKVNVGTQVSEELVEPMGIGRGLGCASHVPLSNDPGSVPVVLEHPGNGYLRCRQSRSFEAPTCPFHPDALLVASGDEGDPCRRAHRRRRVVVRESDAFTSQAVEVRRRQVSGPVGPQIAIAQIVGQDEDDIRSVGRSHQLH